MLVFLVVLCVIVSPCVGRPRNYESSPYNYHDRVNTNDEVTFPQGVDVDEEEVMYDLPENGELFEGDIVMDDRIRRAVWGQQSKKSAVSTLKDMDMLWPNGQIVYDIHDTFTPDHIKMLKEAMAEFEKRTCITFKQRTTETDYVLYTSEKNHCSSNVGKSGGMQKVTLGKSCLILGTFEHETMHVLGFIHEHSRADRDDYIKVLFENIKKKEWNNFHKYKVRDLTNLNETFNFNSIMLYRNNAFSKNGNDTIESIAEPDLHFGQRIKFSAGDVKEINTLYNCVEKLDNPVLDGIYSEYHTKRKKKKDTKLIKSLLDTLMYRDVNTDDELEDNMIY